MCSKRGFYFFCVVNLNQRFEIILLCEINKKRQTLFKHCRNQKHRISTKCPRFSYLLFVYDEVLPEDRDADSGFHPCDILPGTSEEIRFSQHRECHAPASCKCS